MQPNIGDSRSWVQESWQAVLKHRKIDVQYYRINRKATVTKKILEVPSNPLTEVGSRRKSWKYATVAELYRAKVKKGQSKGKVC